MKAKLLLYFVLLIVGHIACKPDQSKKETPVEYEKSKSGQDYQWTEAEGKEFLKDARNTYTSDELWLKRAAEIRLHILKVVNLDPLPEKCDLNSILGGWREYDGYKVRNVAFQSSPDVYVTGSIYSPIKIKG
ncbi:hypothetical protein ACFLU5_01625 [Bacteroidota bacterium]